MDGLRIIATTDLAEDIKIQLFHLWNNEYPVKLAYPDLTEFSEYLKGLKGQSHLLLINDKNEIAGWAFLFDRENIRWFAIIISELNQGKGFGRDMLGRLMKSETELNGWAIDHNNDKKVNGMNYKSPLDFYRKCGFEMLIDQRIELPQISAVKIRWIKDENDYPFVITEK